MPKIRRDAAVFAMKHGVRVSARHFGFSPGAIVNWVKWIKKHGIHPVPTQSSKPKKSPRALKDEVVEKIVAKRFELKRSAEVVHHDLAEEGMRVSLSSVKRTLDRRGLLKKRSPWKRLHLAPPRPVAEKPGDLVQVDTVHLMTGEKTRIYIFTMIDVYSRWGFARAYARAGTKQALDFLRRAQVECLFQFDCIQSDNGSEFSSSFTDRVGVAHRHSRVRKPNDNAHLERFNRTLQEECLCGIPTTINAINRTLPKYLEYYNTKRHHFGLNLKTPISIICSQAVD